MKAKGLVLSERLHIGTITPPGSFEDESRSGVTGAHTDITLTRLPHKLWVPSYNGTSSKIAIGDIGLAVKTVLLWIYPDDNTTRSILDLDGGTHSLEMDGSGNLTATGWAGPTFYVDAVPAAVAIAQAAWNFIAITTATAIDANNVTLGNEASWFDGYQAIVKMLGYVLTPGQIAARFQAQRHWLGV